jgi:peptide methionine sulfoxide reductase MsrA
LKSRLTDWFWLRSVLFYREHGVTTIKRCLTDNGPAYRPKVFNDSLTHTGTAHKFIRPQTPRTNGKVERFNLTMKVEWYNHERPHSALRNKPPASRVPITTYRLAQQSGNFRYAPDRRTRLRAHVVRSAVNNLMRWNT